MKKEVEKRVIVIDFNHMAHTYMNSGHRLSKTLMVNGQPQLIDTTVQSGTIKAIHRWSNHGYNPTAVCFDSPVPARKAYFAKSFGMSVEGDGAYKGRRVAMSGEMFDAITMVKDLLVASGVSCYKGQNYEADDLVFACIERAKKDYPGMPIDVITNDADLLPLVDDTVSVFLRSRKMTWAERPELEKLHYIQVTPDNYQEVVQGLSSYKKFYLPYNTLLLHKILRGDSSDDLDKKFRAVKRMFPPTKFNELIMSLENNGIDLSRLFRYGKCRERYVSIKTGEEVDLNHDRSDMAVVYDEPKEIDDMIDILCWYIEDEDVLEHIRKAYKGMNLNQAYAGFGTISRKPARIGTPIKTFNEGVLQEKVLPLGINLKMNIY